METLIVIVGVVVVFLGWKALSTWANGHDEKPLDWNTRSFPTGAFDLEVVGESNYQPALRKLKRASDKGGSVFVFLVREPDNSYDKNAVMVVSEEGETVGYLSREMARRYKSILETLAGKDCFVRCEAQLRGGDDPKRSSIGIWLDLAAPGEVSKIVGRL